MEFDLAELRRDWIEGVCGEDFIARVHGCRAQIEALPPGARARGALIAEADPVEFAAAFFAAVSLGVPAILANPRWGEQEWAELSGLVAPGGAFRRGFIYEDRSVFGQASANPMNDAPMYDAPAGSILIPTGGTTGGVKLAVHTWASLSAAVPGLQGFLGGGPIHSACQLPLHHVSGLMQLVRSFLSGGRIHFDDAVHEGDCLSLVPTQLQRAMESEAGIRKLNTARVIFAGSAGMPGAVAARARELRLPVVPVYGMTETAAMVAAVPNEDFLTDPQAGAVPLGEARFALDNGQIRVQTPALFRGYHGRDPVDRSEGHLTGDRGSLDAAGRLHVHGRLDRLINTGGEKVDPRQVEAALLQIDGIEGARVHGEPDPEWGQVVVAWVNCAPGLDFAQVRAQLKAQLAAYKVPKRFKRVGVAHHVGASLVKPAAAQSAEPKSAAAQPAAAQSAEPKSAEAQPAAVFTSEAPTGGTLPIRKTQNLRKGRRSMPGVRYFISLCTKDRRAGLTEAALADAILAAWRLQHADGDYVFHCGTVMPDHVHCLFTLGDRFSLGKCIVKFKAKTKEALNTLGLEWQRDFYDHWLRADDSMERFARYVFLNPYRKELLPPDQGWAHWHLSRQYRPEFVEHLDARGAPPTEWLSGSPDLDELLESDCG